MNKKILSILSIVLLSCSEHSAGVPPHGEVGAAVAPTSISGNSSSNAGPTTAVSGGANLTGVTAATASGIVARITNGLQGNVDPTQGNFSKSLALVASNLPKAVNVNNTAGFDQVQLLAFAACADLTSGSNPLMKTVYGVDPKATIAANQSALIAAGMKMLDQHAAGLASGGPAASQLTTIFSGIVTSENSSSSTIVFMTICTAANTAGSSMLGI